MIFKKTTIAGKILFWFLIIALIPLITVSYLTFKTSENAIRHETIENFKVIADSREIMFNEYINGKIRELRLIASRPTVANALGRYRTVFHEAGPESREFASLDKEYRDYFIDLIHDFGYYDAFLIDTDGYIVFTAKRESDFGTNLYDGPLKDSELAENYKMVIREKKFALSEFRQYSPSDEPAAFIGDPVFIDGDPAGVFMLQMSASQLLAMVHDYPGLGNTGEIVIAEKVRDQALFIAPLRHLPDAAFNKHVLLGSNEALPIQKAVQGENGAGISVDYRNKEILAVWRYLPKFKWGIVVKIDTDEAYQHIYELRHWAFMTALLTVIFVILISLWISRSISDPIRALYKGSEIIGGGDLYYKVATDAKDEIGQLSRSFDNMTENLNNSLKVRDNEIAERIRVEESLKKSELWLESIFNSLEEAVFVLSSYRVLINSNKAAEKMFGYSNDELYKQSTEILHVDHDHYMEFGQKISDAFSNGQTAFFEFKAKRKNGEVFPTEHTVSLLKDNNGESIGIVSSVRDITARKEAEYALKESEERYREFVEGTNDFIARVDADGKFLFVNHMADIIFGISPDKCKGMSAFQFIHPDDRERTHEWFKDCIQRHLSQSSIENRQLNQRTGEVHYMLFTSNFNYDENGNIKAINSIARDITERKKYEKQLEDINNEMEQIIHVTSHDMRTPLAVIYGFSRELENTIEKITTAVEKEESLQKIKELFISLKDDTDDILKYVNSSTKKIDSLLKGLLQLSRSGKVELKIEKLDMDKIMSDIINVFQFKAKETGTKLVISELPPCMGDESQINQVFSNLISNALKYRDPGRPCIIKVSGHQQEYERVSYYVEDNGIGIPPEEHEKIFKIFHQVIREKGKGEGLGLTIVKKILERHNGEISVKSEPDKGTEFIISLPS